MKSREAFRLGFTYTGMSAKVWDKEEWEKVKARAQEIKNTYKGADFRVVEDSNSWKNIYGNKLFNRAQWFNQEIEEKYLNEKHQEILNKLKEEYEEKVAKEMEHYNNRKVLYEELMALKK